MINSGLDFDLGYSAADVNELCADLLARRPMILVSNRGPVEHQVPEGQRQSQDQSTRFPNPDVAAAASLPNSMPWPTPSISPGCPAP